jgi:transposase
MPLPARAYKPKDKSLVEGAVRIVYSRIYIHLHERQFTTVGEMNEVIWIHLEELNNAPFSRRTESRRELFEEIEQPLLNPLPLVPYEIRKHLFATVNKTGHVCLGTDKHYYSVPYRFIGKKVKVSYSASDVRIFYNHNCIASHHRSLRQHRYTTDSDHMASTHKFVADWSVDYFLALGLAVHSEVQLYFQKLFERSLHPEQGYRSCMGMLRLAKKYGTERMVAACLRASEYEMYSYRAIKNILERGLDRTEEQDKSKTGTMPDHDNIRGGTYYH